MNHPQPSATKSHRVVIIGGAGNVGKGILQAFSTRSKAWNVIAIDPALEEKEEEQIEVVTATNVSESTPKLNTSGSRQIIKSKIEDINDEIFQTWFYPFSLEKNKNKHDDEYNKTNYHHVEIIVTNENGNRDEYANQPNLGSQNNYRFTNLVKRIVEARENCCTKIQNGESSDCHRITTSVHISYIGGSWTRLQPALNPIHAQTKNSNYLEVNHTSLVKEGGGSNPYEIAKSGAEANARKLSTEYKVGITFYDYISVVPNFAPNFSVNRMIQSGLEKGVIKYSEGMYGRPLLHTNEAGDIVMNIVERDMLSPIQYSKGDVDVGREKLFNSVLIPGHFITFKTFAEVTKETIENKYKSKNVAFDVYENTPNELRIHCNSLMKRVNISSSLVIDGLKETAAFALKQCEEEL